MSHDWVFEQKKPPSYLHKFSSHLIYQEVVSAEMVVSIPLSSPEESWMDEASWLGAAEQVHELQEHTCVLFGGHKLTVEAMCRVRSLRAH